MRALLVVLFGLWLVWPAAALEAQRLQGRVVDEESRAGIMGATLEVVDEAGEVLGEAETDSAGVFAVDLAEAGSYRLRVEHIAYRTLETEPIEVARAEAVRVEVRMGRTVIPLEPLIIETRRDMGRLAGFRERVEADPFGKFVTREEIDARPASTPTDLMQAIPGVTIRPVSRANNPSGMAVKLILMRGTVDFCEPSLYLDGTRIHQSSDAPIDDMLSSVMLEGVEAYTTVGSAPVEYQPTNNCGVVLFWTREAEGTGQRGVWRIVAGVGAFAAILLLTNLR